MIQTFTLNNSVNQLTSASRSGTLTVAGLAQGTPTSVTVKDNGNPAQAATRYADLSFARAGISPVDGANTFTAVAQDAGGRLATNTVTPWLPVSTSFTYDNDGNLTGDGRRTFEYDDADQLKAAQVAGNWRTEFKYDGFGRRRRVRVEKVWNGSAFVTAGETRYVYDHLVVLQERDANNVPQVTYTRGADLSARLQGAGGIGGLLARTDNAALLTSNATNAHAYYYADGGGNITALMDGRQSVVVRYRYDPFGNLLGLAGPLAEANVYRFSSKEFHAVSGLYYYGFRFYEPSLQRWLNQDPLGERGGINLYSYVENDPVNFVDPLGLLKYSYSGGMLFIYPSWWQFWKSEPDVYWGTPELYQRVLRDKGIEDAAVNAAAALAALELQKKLLDDQQKRQTPPANCPKPPGWNDKWKWGAPTGEKEGDWRWFDPDGGEWRRHDKDKWHPDPHWDYNPWDNWNSPWRNIDEKGNPIPKTPAPTPPKAN